MTLSYDRDDNCKIDTPYGSMNMTVHTKNIQIEKYIKNQPEIHKIILKYLITLENEIQYENIVTIELSK